MSIDWIAALDRAAVEVDADSIRELITQIPSSEESLAIGLRDLVDRFCFDEILELTEVILHDTTSLRSKSKDYKFMYVVPSRIESEKITLRRFQQQDLVPFIALMTDRSATRFLAFPQAIKSAEGATKLLETTIAAYNGDRSHFALAVEEKESGKFVGMCGLNPLEEKTVEIFYAVMPEAWGQGFGTEIASRLVRFAIDSLDVKCIKAFIVPSNYRSIHVATKAGFRKTGLVNNPNFAELVAEYIIELTDRSWTTAGSASNRSD
jgi:[ribosomal protein S5]-alanine N-acetyltransferase